MADVDVPGLGPMNQNMVYGGLGAVALYVGYRWYRAKSSPPAAAGDLSGMGSPDGAGLGAPGVGAPSATSYSNPAPGRLGGASAGSSTNGGSAPATDQAWTAAVVSDLQNLGYNPQAVSGALAAYLSSQPLTPDQVTIIRQAWAFEGRPPGNPGLNIIQGGSTTPTPAPGTIPAATTAPVTMSVGKGHSLGEVVKYVQTHGNPNFSYADFWEYNPGIANQLTWTPVDWMFNGWNTTVVIARPGAISSELGKSTFDPATTT